MQVGLRRRAERRAHRQGRLPEDRNQERPEDRGHRQPALREQRQPRHPILQPQRDAGGRRRPHHAAVYHEGVDDQPSGSRLPPAPRRNGRTERVPAGRECIRRADRLPDLEAPDVSTGAPRGRIQALGLRIHHQGQSVFRHPARGCGSWAGPSRPHRESILALFHTRRHRTHDEEAGTLLPTRCRGRRRQPEPRQIGDRGSVSAAGRSASPYSADQGRG